MPQLSCFTPCGMLALSSAKPLSRTIYDSIVANLGGNYKITKGSREDCTAYAQAMGIASARLTMERAGNQGLPTKVHDLLPVREEEYGLTPGPYDTEADRAGALAARYRLPLGASKNNVKNALLDLLGADFIAYRVTTTSEFVATPTNAGDQPMNLQTPSVPFKLVRLTDGVSIGLGAPQQVRYTNAVTFPGITTYVPELLAGDVLVVNPETNGQTERVTVTSTALVEISEGVFETRFTATFTKSHDVNCIATTMPFPYWVSSKRHALIVLSPTASFDPEKRRKVDELMARIARAVSTWNITTGDATTTAGPIAVGLNSIGVTPIAAFSLP